MTFPVADSGVALTELPGKLALYFTFGACQAHCDGCHSPELSRPVTSPWSLPNIEAYAETQIQRGANAILLLGGTTNGVPLPHLRTLINTLAELAPVGLYSGSDDDALHQRLARTTRLTWLKTGSYQKERGGLDDPHTNQRFYRKETHYYGTNAFDIRRSVTLKDLTHLFQTRKDDITC